MPQLMRGVADDAVMVRGGVALGEPQVPPPGRVAERAAAIAVDQPATVERWIGGRLPYRKYRYALAARLGVDEVYLWGSS